MTRWPNGSKAIANGTVPGSAFTVADRERAARAQHLAECEPVATDEEDRDRVAARVHGVEQAVPRVADQRALGRGVVDHGPGQDAAPAAVSLAPAGLDALAKAGVATVTAAAAAAVTRIAVLTKTPHAWGFGVSPL
jgi:hypothetical protein